MHVLLRLSQLAAIIVLAAAPFAASPSRAAPAGSRAGAKDVPSAVGGFVPLGGAVNGAGRAGLDPALALGPAGAPQPWVSFVDGGRVRVANFDSAAGVWGARGDALAGGSAAAVVDVAGATPWAVFVEEVGGAGQVRAAAFNGASWQLPGPGAPPTLNRDPAQDARNPALAAGPAGGAPAPWVAWDESTASGRRVYVGQGGAAWQAVGGALNVNAGRDARAPDIAFAGSGGATPWAVWYESGAGAPGRVFAATHNGASWSLVGGSRVDTGTGTLCIPASEIVCALNINGGRSATMPRIAAGTLPGESAPSPWVVFTEESAAGTRQVFVARLDPAAQDRFVPVGGSLNNSPAQSARDPDIVFVGSVPHVAWVEPLNGVETLFVRHLAVATPGLERWDLDTPAGISRLPGAPVGRPRLATNGSTPFVARHEGSVPDAFVDYRSPDGPAWGSNRPPYIRVISGTLASTGSPFLQDAKALLPASSHAEYLGRAEITTTCSHVGGWDQIAAVQFKVSNAEGTPFLGQYLADAGTFELLDPANPGGPPVGGGRPGTAAAIETVDVIMHLAQMSAISHSAGSAALDMRWVLSFKASTRFQRYVQSINIVYKTSATSTAQTGFFKVGALDVGNQVYTPLVAR